MQDDRRPISWEVELPDNSRWDELEQWAYEHNVDIDKLPPHGHGRNVFDPDYKIVYCARLTCWDKNVALMGKLRWGGAPPTL